MFVEPDLSASQMQGVCSHAARICYNYGRNPVSLHGCVPSKAGMVLHVLLLQNQKPDGVHSLFQHRS